MKINVAKSAGFCFGVKRAIDIALKTASFGKEVCMLGDIVHNEDVVKQISKAGIKKVSSLTSGKGKTLLIRAHGASRSVLLKARRLGYKVVDATCIMVKEIHKIAKEMENKGFRVIIIGDQKHDEVLGIAGQLDHKALVIDSLKKLPVASLKKIKKACIVAQSTQNIDKVLVIVEAIKEYIPKVEFFNTICKPTQIRQNEIRQMPLVNDVMIIVGSSQSANTRRLYEISRSLNPRSYWIGSAKNLKIDWFKNAKRVGITAGASTPDTTMQDVISALKTLTASTSLIY
jgi:4-hydroxy-3-methylbut-2-enyl diphosphate reductase